MKDISTINSRIYIDNSATTRVSDGAVKAMLPYFTEEFGNPSAIYSYGQDAKIAIDKARHTIAKAIGAMPTEIFFTSGGTESDNWAIHSVAEQKSKAGKHIISTAIEHNAVLKTLKKLEWLGFNVTLLTPDSKGQISPKDLEAAIRPDTILVSIMFANNVMGTILDIQTLAQIAHKHGVLFHTDAVQAAGHIPINVRKLDVDLLSLSGHKFHGPKGVGAIFAKIPRLPLPLITGGGQERGGRSGTENVPGIVGMAHALQECIESQKENSVYLRSLRDRLIEEFLKLEGAYLTGDPIARLPGHASFVFEGIKHSALLINKLNEVGICASSGSACSATSQEASHVLMAMGYSQEMALNSFRVSFSRYNTMQELPFIIEKTKLYIQELRNLKKLQVLY
ncbi:MAG: cysteine desulfurase [Deltaproteobacteria bacterium]|jgi:cysteine desulfurase|nr:cysteine desulfurase [Deltaproteobacteria bacterium]